MIVVDSSAWIELFRDTGHPVAHALESILFGGGDVAVTEVIAMELLAGVSSERHAFVLRRDLLAHRFLPLDGLADYERAASLYRASRHAGETVRRLTDCLIAVPAIRVGAEVLHKDRDFDAIARHSDLKVYRAR